MAKNNNQTTIAATESMAIAPPAATRDEEKTKQTDGAAPFIPPNDTVPQRESAYAVAQAQFDNVANFVDLSDDLRRFLRVPQRELIVHFPVKMDDGHMRMFTGYRVHHNMAKGPTKGGIRYHPDVSLDECRALAMWMTWY